MKNDEILARAAEDFEAARAAWAANQAAAREDLEFGRLGRQWHAEDERRRQAEGRPCLTFNKMPAFIRQVVNDARQNKPQIRVHPQDSAGDPEVAQIINGLIRNIEAASDADVAYDTAIEQAVAQGFGFWRVNTRYSGDDGFDQDIVIERIANPFTILGDPASTAADSSDWNLAFVATRMSHAEFAREFPQAKATDWAFDFRAAPDGLGADDNHVTVAEYWTREKVRSEIVALSDGSLVDPEDIGRDPGRFAGLEVVGRPREVSSHKVTQHLLTGAEVLRSVEWAGRFIPIVAVYGDEVIGADGERSFRSLIRDARDAQRMFNYMRTTGIEGLALQPRAPWIGEEGTFDADPNWATANAQSHPYLEYARGRAPPQRQPLPSHFSAALQEAMTAAADMKSIIGLHDASLGARSNETSGRAIIARQREGDVSTFHFIDNLSRSIRHGGRILLDLIPKVYSTERILRVLGEDMQPATVSVAPIGRPAAEVADPRTGAIRKVYDLAAGKYDLTVKAGPSYTTMREEHRAMMMDAAQAGGEAVASVMLPRIARLMDLPDADEMAAELEARLNPQAPPPGGTAAGMERLAQLEQENGALKAQLRDRAGELAIKARDTEISAFEADTRRLQAMGR